MSYDGIDAVGGIDLRVSRGEIFAFLGPNGAGKTTTVEVLEGHRKRTAGDVKVLGQDPEHADRWWHSRVIAATDLLILAICGVVGLLIALRRFEWSPQST